MDKFYLASLSFVELELLKSALGNLLHVYSTICTENPREELSSMVFRFERPIIYYDLLEEHAETEQELRRRYNNAIQENLK